MSIPRRNLVLIALLLATGACASAGRQTTQRCLNEPIDSVFVLAGPVYRGCQVDRPALLQAQGRLDFDLSRAPSHSCMMTELEFVVDTAGVPEALTAKVLHADDANLARALVASLPGWRYRPAELDGRTVRQVIRERVPIQFVVTQASGLRPGPPRFSTTCR